MLGRWVFIERLYPMRVTELVLGRWVFIGSVRALELVLLAGAVDQVGQIGPSFSASVVILLLAPKRSFWSSTCLSGEFEF